VSKSNSSLTSVSVQRKLEPARLINELRGDLDWIVMKALEKDRSRRYETASSLARDIERCLSDEPVEARPPSTGYRIRKFVWKNRKPLAAAAAFAFLLVVGAAVSVWLAARATLAEQLAKANEREANIERDRAVGERERARRHLYAAHMKLVQSAWDESQVGR